MFSIKSTYPYLNKKKKRKRYQSVFKNPSNTVTYTKKDVRNSSGGLSISTRSVNMADLM